MPYLSSQTWRSELLCSTPADCLIEGRRRPISTIPEDNFFARTQKLNELRLPDGFSKKLKPLAATAKYYGAGRPVSKLTGACGARISWFNAFKQLAQIEETKSYDDFNETTITREFQL